MLEMELPGKEEKRKSEEKNMDVVKGDMEMIGEKSTEGRRQSEMEVTPERNG